MCTYMPDNEVMIIRDGLNPGDDIRIETELVALSLISENPVAIGRYSFSVPNGVSMAHDWHRHLGNCP